jgi:hypothetical protein
VSLVRAGPGAIFRLELPALTEVRA